MTNKLTELYELMDGTPSARADLIAAIAEIVEPIPPAPSLRQRLVDGIRVGGRLHRFAPAVARLLDLTEERARALLDALDHRDAWEDPGIPGVGFAWVEGGPAAERCVRGFVRVESGRTFPEHEHVGTERVLVLQGTLTDSVTGERFAPGSIIERPPGTTHAFDVTVGGPDLLQLSVVEEGVILGGVRMNPR
jgi:quercetin dioxygenase-like cupin family protein